MKEDVGLPCKPAIFPVIHVGEFSQMMADAEVAREAGCAGIFLCSAHVEGMRLIALSDRLAETLNHWWVGINCLDLTPEEVFPLVTNNIAGILVDNADIDERRQTQRKATRLTQLRQTSEWQGVYFGGVAMKGQRNVWDIERAGQLAPQFMDVVTTSGPVTGTAPSVEKIQRLKSAIGNSPLAIASGISADNIAQYLGWVDYFLVATSIRTSKKTLNPSKLGALVRAMHSNRE